MTEHIIELSLQVNAPNQTTPLINMKRVEKLFASFLQVLQSVLEEMKHNSVNKFVVCLLPCNCLQLIKND